MPDKDTSEILIIRRGGHTDYDEPKGGVWKIAYADFMTAMMAFFLVMWLINVTDQQTKESVARYFNPIRFAEATVDRKGIRDPEPRPPVEGEKEGQGKAVPAPPQGPAREGPGASAPGRQTRSEAALFQDPYAVLADIAASAPVEPRAAALAVEGIPGEGSKPGLSAGDQARDPFDPVYWQVSAKAQIPRGTGESRGQAGAPDAGAALPAPPAKRDAAGEGKAMAAKPAPKPADAKADAAALATRDVAETASPVPTAEAQGAKPPESKASEAKMVEAKMADAKMVEAKAAEPKLVEGKGGEGKAGEGKAGEAKPIERRVAELRESIATAVGRVQSAGAPDIRVESTGEGVLVSLTDAPDFGMFAIGSAEPRPEAVRIVEKVAEVIRKGGGPVVVRGHTDGRPFRSKDYDNWRLSSARAHMAAYMLIRGGIPEARIERIEGWADRSLKVAADPGAAANRRIEILLREPRP
ncbi:MotB family protein [Salinarimonas soli]|uniref:MotB family protein n=1 Tax=Salinarimonas soli TaxID=1638099 RepID=A0A5B2VEV9_9HYPH|nr:MotB family protein [Salinarimonas soli]KAA2237375.1 MotB family protein [Salinarimonas soli]